MDKAKLANALAKNVKRIRLEKNMSQEALASKSGVTLDLIKQVENGNIRIDFDIKELKSQT